MLRPAIMTRSDGSRKRDKINLPALAQDWRESLVPEGNPHGAVNQAVSVEETSTSLIVVTTEGKTLRWDLV